jgi:hypothetical protein
MKTTLYIIAGLLLIAWVFGFFMFKAGALIHVFIILSCLSLMQGIILTPRALLEKRPVS